MSQKYLGFIEAGEPGRMLPSRTSDELKLAAHPVGVMILALLLEESLLRIHSSTKVGQGQVHEED